MDEFCGHLVGGQKPDTKGSTQTETKPAYRVGHQESKCLGRKVGEMTGRRLDMFHFLLWVVVLWSVCLTHFSVSVL